MSQLRETVIPLAVIVAVLGAGAWFHEPLEKHFRKGLPPEARKSLGSLGLEKSQEAALVSAVAPPAPAARKDKVYRWVDAQGHTHYEQQAGRGREAVEVDQSRIQSLNDYKGPVGHRSE